MADQVRDRVPTYNAHDIMISNASSRVYVPQRAESSCQSSRLTTSRDSLRQTVEAHRADSEACAGVGRGETENCVLLPHACRARGAETRLSLGGG